jgi:hypothetical protein
MTEQNMGDFTLYFLGYDHDGISALPAEQKAKARFNREGKVTSSNYLLSPMNSLHYAHTYQASLSLLTTMALNPTRTSKVTPAATLTPAEGSATSQLPCKTSKRHVRASKAWAFLSRSVSPMVR